MSAEPNEYNLEAMRVSKRLQLEGLTKVEFTEILKDVALMWTLSLHEFEKNNMSRAGFDPLNH
ncbi:MAG: hypothetical protein FIO02_10820 [Nitrosopumilales archaeon]|jgi:hypothetical protein|nr:hypothetical protein [Nitrosopumilales archaeon]MRN62378.1 hypothetical protein [Nitrosopumilales archaeon]